MTKTGTIQDDRTKTLEYAIRCAELEACTLNYISEATAHLDELNQLTSNALREVVEVLGCLWGIDIKSVPTGEWEARLLAYYREEGGRPNVCPRKKLDAMESAAFKVIQELAKGMPVAGMFYPFPEAVAGDDVVTS
jgi:hypothetical protein